MKGKTSIILILIHSILNVSNAQTDSLYFKGTLNVNTVGSYPYNLVIYPKNGKWQGYSLLDAGGPNETKSSVYAHFSKEQSAFIFSEKALIHTKSTVKNFCFVAGVAKMTPKKNELRGFFSGKDEQNKPCGIGTVKFNLPEGVKALLTPDGTRDTNLVMPLTKLHTETFSASGKQVILEIWDGGMEDHDSLSITLNNRVLEAGIEITATKRTITIDLPKGKSVLKVRALNEGSQKPNSARITLMDSGNKLSLASFLKEGEEARVEITY